MFIYNIIKIKWQGGISWSHLDIVNNYVHTMGTFISLKVVLFDQEGPSSKGVEITFVTAPQLGQKIQERL